MRRVPDPRDCRRAQQHVTLPTALWTRRVSACLRSLAGYKMAKVHGPFLSPQRSMESSVNRGFSIPWLNTGNYPWTISGGENWREKFWRSVFDTCETRWQNLVVDRSLRLSEPCFQGEWSRLTLPWELTRQRRPEGSGETCSFRRGFLSFKISSWVILHHRKREREFGYSLIYLRYVFGPHKISSWMVLHHRKKERKRVRLLSHLLTICFWPS